MKKFSTLIAFLLAITMVFTACAPPKEETVKPNSEATATQAEEAKTDAPTEAETEKATEAPATEAETEAPSEEETEAPAEKETESEKLEETEAEKLPAAAADEEKETEPEAEEETEAEKETEPEAEEATEPEKEAESEDEAAEVEKLPPITVGLATDTGGVDDKSFNQGTWEGILRFAKDQDLPEENYQYVQATSDADYIPQLTTFADMGLDLIVAPGFLFKSAITEVAENYPDQNFLFIDDASDAPNVLNAVFAEHEGSFLVGVAAALKADAAGKDKVGFVGGMDFETIQKFEAGFEQGVHAVNPDIEVVVEYVGGFDRPEDAQAIATKMYDSGVYIIYHAAGGAGNGVIKEAKDRAINGEDVWVIGVDRDQYEEGIYEGSMENGDEKSVILTSMVKRVDNASYLVCEMVAKGEFKGGTRTFTLADQGLAIPEDNPNLEDDWIKTIKEYEDKIVNGDIEVNPVPERVQEEAAETPEEEVTEEEKADATEAPEEDTEAEKEEAAATEAEKLPAAVGEEEKEAEAEPDKTEAEPEKEAEEEPAKEDESEAEEKPEEEPAEELKIEDFPQIAPLVDTLKKVEMDGKEVENVSFYTMIMADEYEGEIYPYESHYIRLNDLAALASGTDAKFNVEYGEKDGQKTITLTTGEDYKVDEEKDLVERDSVDSFEPVEDVTYIIDGEELEKPLDALKFGDDYYLQLGSIRRALKGIYHTDLIEEEGQEALFRFYPFASDIPVKTLDEFKDLIKGNEYTVTFATGTWCYWCHQEYERGHVQEFVEYAKDHDVKVVNLMEDYTNLDMKLLQEKTGIEASDKFIYIALTDEIADYYANELNQGDHELWFPTILLLNSDGERIIEYNNDEDYSWVDLIKMNDNDELQAVIDARAAEEEEEMPEEEAEPEEEVVEEEAETPEEEAVEEEVKEPAAADEEKETEPEAEEETEAEKETEPEAEEATEPEKEAESEDEAAEVEKLPPITVGLATDTGGVDDKSFNQGTWEGILRFAKDQDLPEENYQYVQATSDADYIPQLTTFADMGLDLIVAPGFLFKSAITEVAENYPDQNFLFIDDASDAPNVLNAVFAEHEGSFLVGVAAALKADAAGKDKVGFVGGMDFETIQKFEAGFEQGVHAVNPDIEVVVEYVGGFDRPEDAQAIATKMYDSGVYIIYHAAGGAGNGVIKEAKDRAINGEDVWVIGVDRDQYEEGIYEGSMENGDEKSVILTSMVKRVDNASYLVCEMVAKGEFKGGTRTFTLADQGLAIPEDNPNLEDDWIKTIKEYEDKIVNGDIEVNPVPERVQEAETKDAA